MSIPDRIWINEKWEAYLRPTFEGDTSGYIRADLAAVQPAQVLDLIPRMDAIQACQVGPSDEWAKATKSGYEQAATDCQRNILRIEPQPGPRDKVLNQAMKDAITMGEGWIRTLPDGTLQLIDPSAVRLMPDLHDPRDEVIARLVGALDGWVNIACHCNITDGSCCCGDDMENHAEPINCGHVSVDHGSYIADGMLKTTQAALAAAKAVQR